MRKVTVTVTSIMLLFIASAHGKAAKFDPMHKEIKAKIAQLNTQIGKKTTNKARLQRERDQLLRKLKELSPHKKANNSPVVATSKG